ncbi:MAG: TonB family protein [Pseudomonadota bacterium]
MAYADQEMSGNKLVAIIIVGIIHVAIGYLLITGLAISAVKNVVERVTTVDVEEPEPEPEEEEPPPPPPDETTPPPVVVPPPLFPPQNQNQLEDTSEDIPERDETPDVRPTPTPTATPTPTPTVADLSQPVRPVRQGRWASQIANNYPRRAETREIEGVVGVRVTVGTNGRVSGCTVSSSSGSSILDDAACKGMRRYARFEPALDRAGNPTSGSWSTRIRYELTN